MASRAFAVLLFAGLLSSARVVRAGDDDALYACKPAASDAKMTVSFKPDTSIYDLSVWLTSFTCKNVVFSADVAKRASKVTVIAPAAVTPKQAVKLFTDAVDALGLIVTQKGDTFIIKLGPGLPKSCPDLPDTVTAAAAPADAPASLSQAELDAGITRIDELHYMITRALLDKFLADPARLRSARVAPSMKAGKPNGVKIYAIRPSSLLARLGFLNGDTVQAINGQPLADTALTLDAYQKPKPSSTFTFALIRRGKPETLTITVK